MAIIMEKMNKKIKSIAIIVFVAACAIGGVVMLYISKENSAYQEPAQQVSKTDHDYHEIVKDGKTYEFNTDIISVLALGIDRSSDTQQGQSDFISILLFDRGTKQINVLSISRDAMTPIVMYAADGSDLGWNEQHLALAYANGKDEQSGALNSSKAVSKMLNDVPIVYYATADLTSFAGFHEVVGDLQVEVPDDSLSYLHKGWDKGKVVTLTTQNVEQFLRSRDTEVSFSNDTRMKRQQVYMKAYVAKLKTLLETDYEATLKRMLKAYQSFSTNIALGDIESFAQMVLTYEFNDDNFFSVKGNDQEGMFHDEFIIDRDALDQQILELFYKET